MVKIQKMGDSLIFTMNRKKILTQHKINDNVIVVMKSSKLNKDIQFISILRDLNFKTSYIHIPRDIKKTYNIQIGDEYTVIIRKLIIKDDKNGDD